MRATAAIVSLMGSWAGLVLAALMAITAGAVEQQIDWEAIEGCPSEATIVAATNTYLGGALADYPRVVIARGRVEAGPAGYRLELEIEVDGRSERHDFVETDCDQIGRDVALLIASAVDPFALGPRPPADRQLLLEPVVVQHPRSRPTPAPAPTPPRGRSTVAQPPPPIVVQAVEPSPAVDVSEPRDRPPARRLAGTLGVAGTGFAGLFPQVGGGVSIEGGLERGLFRWQVGAMGWFGGDFGDAGGGASVDLWAATGSTGLCVSPGLRRFRFAACAVAGIGAITATSINTQTPRTLARPWAFAGPDLRATWIPRPRLGVYLGVSVLPALVRPGWSVSNPAASFRVPPVAGLLRLGIELRNLVTESARRGQSRLHASRGRH